MCRNCLKKDRKYRKKRRREQRAKEKSAGTRSAKRLKRIVDDICDEVRAQLKDRSVSDVIKRER